MLSRCKRYPIVIDVQEADETDVGHPVFDSAFLDMSAATAIYSSSVRTSVYRQNPNLDPGYGGVRIIHYDCTAVLIEGKEFHLDDRPESIIHSTTTNESVSHNTSSFAIRVALKAMGVDIYSDPKFDKLIYNAAELFNGSKQDLEDYATKVALEILSSVNG